METQTYHGTAPFEAASQTSEEAATAITPQLARLQYRVLKSICRESGTSDDVESRIGLSHQTASARLRELYLKGMITAVGRATNRSGRTAVLWGITQQGFTALDYPAFDESETMTAIRPVKILFNGEEVKTGRVTVNLEEQ